MYSFTYAEIDEQLRRLDITPAYQQSLSEMPTRIRTALKKQGFTFNAKTVDMTNKPVLDRVDEACPGVESLTSALRVM